GCGVLAAVGIVLLGVANAPGGGIHKLPRGPRAGDTFTVWNIVASSTADELMFETTGPTSYGWLAGARCPGLDAPRAEQMAALRRMYELVKRKHATLRVVQEHGPDRLGSPLVAITLPDGKDLAEAL